MFKLMIVLAALLALLACAAWFYPEKFLCLDSGNVTADVIVLLGGGVERPQRAVELYRAHAAPRILISGAGDDEIYRQYLLTHGIPARAIEVENKSTSTHENAVFSLRQLRAERIQSAILVTSWYHSRRSERTFEHYAPEIKFYSRPTYYGFARADWGRNKIGRRAHIEFLKIPGYWLCYGVNPF